MKNIIVTGAAGNLAAAVLRELLDKGYRVIATVRSGTEAAVTAHPNLEVQEADASLPAEPAQLIREMATRHGTVDGLVHLVGGYAGGKLAETSTEAIRSMLALNFETAFHYVQPALEQMKSQDGGGRMVLVGSRPGKIPAAARQSVAYALSKSLVFRLAEIVNEEGREKNILATVVVPTTIDTTANRQSMPNADFSKWNRPGEIASRMEKFLSGEDTSLLIEF